MLPHAQDARDETPIEAERRRAFREAVVAIGRLMPEGERDRTRGFKVLVSDLSLRGVCLRTRREISIGEFYAFHLLLGPLRARSRLRVVRTRRRADGTVQAGCEFV